MFREENRMDRAKQIKDTVMVVSENTFCVPSQNRRGKAHIVKIEKEEEPVYIEEILKEAKELHKISNCSQRFNEFVVKVKPLIYKLTQIENTTVKYTCTCEDFAFHGEELNCKHILAVKLNQKEVI